MKDLTKGSAGRVIFWFALPMLVGNIFQQLYNIVDSIVVGHFLGKEALSAVGASFPIIFALISLIIGIAMGFTIIISQYFGAKDYERIGLTIDTMNVVMLVASAVISFFGIFFSKEIFRLIDLPEEIIPSAVIYFNIYVGGVVVMFGLNGTGAILRGLGDSKTPLYFLILSTILNVAFDLIFVVVFKWGIAGAAWATVLSQAISLAAIIIYLNRTHELIKFNLWKLKFDKQIFIKSVKIGLPSGVQQMFVALGMMAMYKIVNMFTTNTIAAFAVVSRIDSFAMMPAMNFSQAFTPFVGQNIGANRHERVISGLKATLLLTGIISVTFSGIALLFGRELMSAFTPDIEVINVGVEYLTIVGAFYIVFSTMFTLNSVFRGAGDTIIPMFITLLALWAIRIPLSYFLSQKYGESGIWWGIPIAWIFGMVMAYAYFLTARWKTVSVIRR